MASRRLRAFKRWMSSNSISHSDALDIIDDGELAGIRVMSKRDLKEGDIIATIPKNSCMTIKTSGANELIEVAGLDGCLGLSVAIMYERSLGVESPWASYLQLLPKAEPLPLVWSLDEVETLLCGTELHKTVKEDKALIYEDWKECILPLLESDEFPYDANFFGLEEYFAARSLVASRAFQIDDYHGIGMVPLADLFNHKTGEEDVHFTTVPSPSESGDSAESLSDDEDSINGEQLIPQISTKSEENGLVTDVGGPSPEVESQGAPDNPLVLEMILVKDVNAGAEVFNTYGITGNAALLHRYGFTEVDNSYDIVNIDLELVIQWSLSFQTSRCSRARVSLWRMLDCNGCISQNSEYFEISHDGEPQHELLILLYIFLLPEEAYTELDLALATTGKLADSPFPHLPQNRKILCRDISELSVDILLTKDVCKAILSLADMRESLYGTRSLEDDLENLKRCNCNAERKLHHSLVLRISERRILQKLRSSAEKGANSSGKTGQSRKKLKS